MLRYALLIALIGCSKADQATPVTQGSAVRDAAALAPPHAPVAKIAWGCFHSNMPWGNGQQSQSVVYDLDAKTLTRDNVDRPNTPDNIPPPPDSPEAGKHEHSTAPIAADTLATLRAGAERVLANAPYEQELPPSEGISCELELLDAAGKSLIRVAKARQEKPDAANALIKTL